MPDALSKTVPIWLTIFNRLLLPDMTQYHSLHVPMDVVSASEKQQIESRLEGFLAQVKALDLDLAAFRAQLNGKPMVCVWQRPGDVDSLDRSDADKVNTIVLCTASNRTSTERSNDAYYIQGAADDHETWSLGLNAPAFWANSEQLLSCSEQDLPELVTSILAKAPGEVAVDRPVLIKPANFLWLASDAPAEVHAADFDIIISCTLKPNEVIARKFKKRYICMTCTTGKVGSRQLRTELSKILDLPNLLDATAGAPSTRILVTCQSGIDLAVGTALAVLCRFGTPTGSLSAHQAPPRINKDMIKHRLSWIMISAPHVKPSRATLQSVNSFLMNN
jgi:tRNA A64-2'-O-ribosylphosphate transferase